MLFSVNKVLQLQGSGGFGIETRWVHFSNFCVILTVLKVHGGSGYYFL